MNESNFAGNILALRALLAQCIAKMHCMDTESIKTSREEIYILFDKTLMLDDLNLTQCIPHAIRYADEIFDLADLIARTPGASP